MTIIEKKSKRKATAILNLVKSGEYSLSYALMIAEELNDNGKLLDLDYEPLAEHLEELINKEENNVNTEEFDEFTEEKQENNEE